MPQILPESDSPPRSPPDWPAMMDALDHVVFAADAAGRFTFLNRAWSDFLGYGIAESLGKSMGEFLDGENGPTPWAQGGLAGVRRQLRFRRRDGQMVLLELSSCASSNGGIVGSILRVASRPLEMAQKNLETEQFVYAVCHDLKSPLVTFLGYVGYIKRDLNEGRTDRLADFADRIENAARRMRRTIDELANLERLSKMDGPPGAVNLSELARETIEAHSQKIAERQAVIKVHPHLPIVSGNRSRLGRLLDNLLGNALKYACPRPGSTIVIGAEDHGSEIRLFVRDQGPGIAPQYHQKIFVLFQRLSADPDGTGVGLAIVQRIAQLHGGRAWVESEPPNGATFWVALSKPKSGELL